MDVVAPLSAFGRDDLAAAGGKGANLGELIRAGFPVPDGFVITTAARSTMTPSLRAQILASYEGMGRVAVRSSATAEDLPGASFAGQQETYLDVVGSDAVIEAVEKCWASLWGERAVAYRSRAGIDSSQVGIAVVVQRMVPADIAGVMFTADPLTGARDRTVIDAAAGLGEAVVSGTVTPSQYVLSCGRFLRGSPDPRLKALAALGERVASQFGRPQDIEWAIVDDRIWLLQARPMTALPPPPVKLNRFQRRLGTVLLEYLPVRPYPMDMSTWIPYGPAGLMAEVVGHFGLRGAFENFLPEEDGVVVAFIPPSPKPSLGLLRAPFRIASLARRYDPAKWTEDPVFVDFLRRVSDASAVDLTALSWDDLLRMPRLALDLVSPITTLRIRYLPRSGLAIARLFLALKLRGKGALFGDLLAGAHTRTTDANRALASLSEDADLTDFLREYGHRETSTPILMTPPTWGDDPSTVRTLIRLLASSPPREVDVAGRALALLNPGPRMRRWIDAACAGLAFREDSHFYFTKPLPLLRQSILEIGRRLGIGEDVFHLRLEEISRHPDLSLIASFIAARKAKRAELAGVPLIDPTLIFRPRFDSAALVTGTPASGGTVDGNVKVILSPAEFSKLDSGEILVCPYTNPSWTPLFQRAAAVVVDSGGVGSHAAIVAREYGIPAIMGTANGTSVLRDGQAVFVDGNLGRVTLP